MANTKQSKSPSSPAEAAKSATTSAPLPEIVEAATPDIFENCVALMVRFSTFGNTRGVAMSDTEAGGASKDMLHLSKSLLDKKALREVNGIPNKVKKALLDKCAVPSFSVDGMYLLSNAGVPIAQKILNTAKSDIAVVVDKLVTNLDVLKAQAKEALGPRYNENEYPTAAELKAEYGVRFRYMSLGAPAQLKSIDGAYIAEAEAEIKAESAKAAAEIRTLYRASLAKLTGHMADMLRPTADGKPRRFHPSALKNVNDFLASLEVRNITNDAEIVALGQQVKDITAGLKVSDLKDNDALRAKVAADMSNVAASLETLVTKGRAIFIDDEPIMTAARKAARTRAKLRGADAATADDKSEAA